MAIDAAVEWEFRAANGTSTNGGGFKNGASGTDYSQQNSPQLSPSDLAMGSGSTTLTSAAGGFTAAMIGNVIQITSGTNFTTGFYEITAHTDTNTVTIDSTAASGAGSSGQGYVGGALTVLTDAFLEGLVAGQTVWVKNDGTMTLTGAIQLSRDGTASAYLRLLGYNSTHNEDPPASGTDRPLIACGSRLFALDNYWEVKNLRFTSTASQACRTDEMGLMENLLVTNQSTGSSTRRLFYFGGNGGNIINCEGTKSSTNTRVYGIRLCLAGSAIGVYFHDIYVGVECPTDRMMVAFCIMDTMALSGAKITSRTGHKFLNNTFYDCATGLSGTTPQRIAIFNNTFSDCTTGISFSSIGTQYLDYNNYYNNGTDVNNQNKGDSALAVDPGFTDAPNGNFTVGANLKATAFPGAFPGGLSTGYLDTGAVQVEAAGGSTSAVIGVIGG